MIPDSSLYMLCTAEQLADSLEMQPSRRVHVKKCELIPADGKDVGPEMTKTVQTPDLCHH